MIRSLTKETHQMFGYMGTYKTYKMLKTHYQCFNMYRSIKRILKTCDIFQKTKIHNKTTRGPMI